MIARCQEADITSCAAPTLSRPSVVSMRLPLSAAPTHGSASALLPAFALGVGLGAFVDGMVLHMVLGLFPTLNVVWNRLLDLLAWFATAVGIVLLWRGGLQGAAPSPRQLAGGILAGFALFNLVEGLIDRHLLGLDRLRSAPAAMPWTVGVLLASALLLAIGIAVARGRRDAGMDRSGLR